MLSSEIRNLGRRCAALHRSKDALGERLDQLEAGRTEYAGVDAEYQKAFDQLWDTEDAILAAPAISICDLAVKAKIIATRARLDVDLTHDIATLLQWQPAPSEPQH